MTAHREITLEGQYANLALLADEIQNDPDLKDAVRLRLTNDSGTADGSLRYGEWAQLVVDLGVGLISSATYEGIRAIIRRARARGRIDESEGEDQSGTDQSE